MTAEPSPPAPPEARGLRIAIAFGILVAVIVIYVLSLIAVHLLAKSAPALPAVDLSKVEAEDSVVQVRLEKLDTVANRLTVNVLVYPKDSLYDKTSVCWPPTRRCGCTRRTTWETCSTR
jgi:hypothetical protein